jgi:hypothetical protein
MKVAVKKIINQAILNANTINAESDLFMQWNRFVYSTKKHTSFKIYFAQKIFSVNIDKYEFNKKIL